MSSFFNRIARLASFGKSRRLVGRDLEGNRYYELPPVNSGRTKRVVEYKVERDIADYTNGINRLPVQWTTWLSHTRADPPSIQELTADSSRQHRLNSLIADIEERERLERIRQGYLPAPEEGDSVGRISGPRTASEEKHSGMRYHLGAGSGSRINTAPSFAKPASQAPPASSTASTPPGQEGSRAEKVDWQSRPSTSRLYPSATSPPSPGRETSQQVYPVPTPTSTHVPPPAESVDPSKYDDPAELRKLAEEDTKRRMQSADVPTPAAPTGPPAQSSRIKPRRRGGA